MISCERGKGCLLYGRWQMFAVQPGRVEFYAESKSNLFLGDGELIPVPRVEVVCLKRRENNFL